MQCPQCGAAIPEQEWNCPQCRINVYWAHEHYTELAGIRTHQGLTPATPTPAFLRQSHQHEMSARAARGGQGDSKVRSIARRAMASSPGE